MNAKQYQWPIAAGQKPGNVLAKYLALGAETHSRLLAQGCVRVDGQQVLRNAPVMRDGQLRLNLPADMLQPLEVLYEDERHLLVVKPVNRPVCDHPGLTMEDMTCLLGHGSALACHRLDATTGGVLWMAKDGEALLQARELLRARALGKRYHAVVLGAPPQMQGKMRHFLRKDAKKAVVRAYDYPLPGAKEARARYRVLRTGRGATLLEVELETGRTHQIRVQCAAMGFALLGDDKYGDRAANRAHKLRYPCLWAVSLAFPGDISGALAALSGRCFESRPAWPKEVERIGLI